MNGTALADTLTKIIKIAGTLTAVGVFVGIVWSSFEAWSEVEANSRHREEAEPVLKTLTEILRNQEQREQEAAAVEESQRRTCKSGQMDRTWCMFHGFEVPSRPEPSQ